MFSTRVLLQHRQPMIKFLGKRTAPKVDHTPKAHPASPTHELPDSFASYRQKSQQHGPIGASASYSTTSKAALSPSGRSLGPIEPKAGEVLDRNELPLRFRRAPTTLEEMEAIDSAGASLFN